MKKAVLTTRGLFPFQKTSTYPAEDAAACPIPE